MSDYETIKAHCLANNQLWEDPDFPPILSSVFYYQVPPFHFTWRRPKEIFASPIFMHENDNGGNQIIPGRLGDKWLVTCIGILRMFKGLLFRFVIGDQPLDNNYAGIFRFYLWWNSEWTEVLVDDNLPTINDQLVFLHMENGQEIWPALLEKAYAKVLGSYEALKYGNFMDGLADMTGGISETRLMSDINIEGLMLLQNTATIITVTYTPDVDSPSYVACDIEPNTTYVVSNVKEVRSTKHDIWTVLLKKPQADEFIVRIVLNPSAWRFITNNDVLESGTGSIILYSDFCRMFPRVNCLHLEPDSCKNDWNWANKRQWKVQTYQGSWKNGVTAGGCKNHQNYFYINPQIKITLYETDEIIICLNQHRVMDARIIGFCIFNARNLTTNMATQQFFRNRNNNMMNSEFMNVRRISLRVKFETGSYLIVPSTYTARKYANFSLRVFSTKPLQMVHLDDEPQLFGSFLIKIPFGAEPEYFALYESVFLQVADDKKTVDAYELHDVLENCLPNDYIKSCSAIDTCKQIILTMDKSETGRLSLSNFRDLICNLRRWQMVFNRNSKEQVGILRAERLRETLKEMGFSVSECVLTLLTFRYMRKEGALRFCDFVSLILHLYRAFEVFHSMNKQTMNLEEWLKINFKV